MKKRIFFAIILVGVAFVFFQLFYGGRPAIVPPKDTFDVVSHRGVHVNWEKGTYDRGTGCEAQHIYEPTHEYIENTLESIRAAFDMGATIIEIDIRRTGDNELVIFHDGMLECRTNGEGEVSEHTLDYLKSLDIGYGYTYDDGQTFPFRGRGVGLMPTLTEVLQEFPDGSFLLDHKDGSMETAALLLDVIEQVPQEQQARLYYWGPEEVYAYVHSEAPAVTRLLANRPLAKRCFLPYVLTFGLGGFPEECRGEGLGLPAQYVRLAWGWPYRFLRTASRAGVRFYVIVDSEEDAAAFSDTPVDGIITDYIEVIGPYYQQD
jgi:glycerophosphoryl diester phosphodiesterase